ncbi:hypothetical protein [Actinoplanes regularis]|uniref:Uncharacterized protein n=1 Tax=Actinoplanes regularis TaxID=52697 RepID=A0A239AXH1_9ACTN|nr:hypothetical protein [Actinoplanes regularis]GIE87329.1 hypothetical protein Are01nite_38090 [Actinoplanes regularis]SNR99724.1 hypothetical protein SAMN06264365_108156 [Actinoplanes regularis]
MVVADPYRRWRRAVYYAGVAVVCLLTAAVLIFLLSCLVGMLPGVGSGRSG